MVISEYFKKIHVDKKVNNKDKMHYREINKKFMCKI